MWICRNKNCALLHENPQKQACRACGTKRAQTDTAAAATQPPAAPAPAAATPKRVTLLNRYSPLPESDAAEGIALDAGDEVGEELHSARESLQEQPDLAKSFNNVEAAALLEKQLDALAPASKEQKDKDARYFSQQIVARADRLKRIVAKLQVTATDAAVTQRRLAEEKARDLADMLKAYEVKRDAHAATYDEAIAAAKEEEKQAGSDIGKEKSRHAAEEARMKDAVVNVHSQPGARKDRRAPWADKMESDGEDIEEDENGDLEEEASVLTTLATDTKDTAEAVNTALGLTGDKAMSPELLSNIVQAHLRAAADLQAQADSRRAAEHYGKLDAATAAASAARDERHAQRQKEHQDAEEKRETKAANEGQVPPHSTNARGRSRTPPADRQEPIPPPPPLPQQPASGSATSIPIAVMVKDKSKNQATKAAKKARKN